MAFWSSRLERQGPTELVEEMITFGQVVLLARCDNIAPLVPATPAARNHMIHRVREGRAVDATATIATKDRSAGQWRGSGPTRDSHHMEETDDGGDLNHHVSGAEHWSFRSRGDRFSPSGQNKDDCSAIRHKGQWLVGRIEKQDPCCHCSQATGGEVALAGTIASTR